MLTPDPTFDPFHGASVVGGQIASERPSDIPPMASDPQLGAPMPNDPPGRGSKNAIQGRRNAGPSTSGGCVGPGGWNTTRREVVIAGRSWIFQHALLDVECVADAYTAHELLYQRTDFFSDCGAQARITGNDRLAQEIAERLKRRHRVN